MHSYIHSLLWLAFTCTAVCQDVLPPQFLPYTGPTIAYPDTQIAFDLLALDRQPDSNGGNVQYELLAAPTNTSLEVFIERPPAKVAFITWRTPPRSALGTTNLFVIRATDQGTPALSATNEVSFVLTDLPPIRSLAVSNGVTVLQIDNLLPNKPYTVQWADALPATNWLLLTVEYPASPSIAVTDTNPLTAQRFYRLCSYGWCYSVHCP